MALARDLMTVTRLESLVAESAGTFTRADDPDSLPPGDSVDLLLVDWSDRGPDWGEQITAWRETVASGPRVILFGPHADLDAHAAARESGLGPMKARSALFTSLPDLLSG